MIERLQKYLAQAGVASRRQAEQMMQEGRVRVNGQVVSELGVKIDSDRDFVKVDGKTVRPERLAYILMNKPKNTICTLDDPGRRVRVVDLVRGVKARLFPVGRLDWDTTGALLLTNDGELANLLIHPRHSVPRTYVAKIKGIPTPERLAKLKKGVYLDGRRTLPAYAKLLSVKEKNSLIQLTLREGRNRQVKRMCQAIGHPCLRLTRVAFGSLTVNDLAPGAWRHLTAEEVAYLKAAAVKTAERAGQDSKSSHLKGREGE
jgi:pseudouridine synthase